MEKRKRYLYLRTLKNVDFTVFCVDKDQKTYFNKEFGVYLPYSSGQQTKRSVLESILDELDLTKCPVTLKYGIENLKIKQKEVIQPCDPTYFDQLIGGFMSAPEKDEKKKSKKRKTIDVESETEEVNDNELESDDAVYKRRSPFSISALTPIHPLLATVFNEKVIFDRSENVLDNVVLKNSKGIAMSIDEIEEFLDENNKRISKRKFVGEKKRANGLFKNDIVIDLNRLFRVPILDNDKEISSTTQQKLLDNGWIVIENNLGKWLELPKEKHDEAAESIARGIVNWRITSNQSRTLDFMSTLSIAISNNAHEISSAIRADLVDFDLDGKERVKLVIDEYYPNTKIYSTKLLNAHVLNAKTSYTALEDAVSEIKNRILEYYI